MMVRWCLWLFCFWILLSGAQTAAQSDIEVFFTADIGSPLIGQPIDLLFTVQVPDGTEVNLPVFPTDWPPFMIQNISEVSTTTSNGITIHSQHLIVSLWRPGEYQTPETLVEYQLPNSTETRQIPAQPAYFDVKSILDANDLKLRPLKPPVSMFYIPPLVVGLGVLTLGAVGAFVWSKRNRFIISRLATNPNKLHPAAQAALSEIKRIDNANNASPNAYAVVSDALRRYLLGRFGVRAIDMTSQELMVDLSQGQDLSERRQRELVNLLEQADLVKFAGIQPSSKFTDKLLNVAYGWVMAVEQESIEAEE
jgi:hypothetical protein